MFNIGFGELAVICIVLIIAVGPDRLPSMMKTLGKTIRTLRQASRDIRASTGIDDLMREDFDLYAPLKPAPQLRRLAPMPEPEPEPAAIPANVGAAEVPVAPAAIPIVAPSEPQPVSREDVVVSSTHEGDRPSVVMAPAPQAVGLPPETLPEALPPEQLTGVDAPHSPQPAAATSAPLPAADKPITSNVDTLPRAPIIQNPTAPLVPAQHSQDSAAKTEPGAAQAPDSAAAPSEPKPRDATES